jgi:hypothetical protein
MLMLFRSRARRYENDMRLFGRRHRLKRLDSDLILKEHDKGIALQHDEAPGVQQSIVETKG